MHSITDGGSARRLTLLEASLQEAVSAASLQPVAAALEPLCLANDLFPVEEGLVAAASLRRRTEFCTGRRCARRALERVGCSPRPLMRGKFGQPLWPSGYLGSISHDGRFAAAIAFRSNARHPILSIDVIDLIDPDHFLDVVDIMAHPAEPPRRPRHLDVARLFSAKEAAIKIISPLIESFVDFKELIAIETGNGFDIWMENRGLKISVSIIQVDDAIISIGIGASIPTCSGC
jgi:enterobactin synthetase component D / holo-[acyl-carrier protein] synthase